MEMTDLCLAFYLLFFFLVVRGASVMSQLRAIRDIFIDNRYPEDVIESNIKYMVTKFRDTIKVFGPLKCPV